MIHLVRHASAGDRGAWRGDDFQRPLDDLGLMQAEAIGVELASAPVRRVLSSPAVRCLQTVEPLARRLRLAVEPASLMAEGTFASDALDLVSSLVVEDGDSVLCSHGDVIPGVLWLLDRFGVDIPDRGRCKKASIWSLTVSSDGIVSASYRHPGTFGAA